MYILDVLVFSVLCVCVVSSLCEVFTIKQVFATLRCSFPFPYAVFTGTGRFVRWSIWFNRDLKNQVFITSVRLFLQ